MTLVVYTTLSDVQLVSVVDAVHAPGGENWMLELFEEETGTDGTTIPV